MFRVSGHTTEGQTVTMGVFPLRGAVFTIRAHVERHTLYPKLTSLSACGCPLSGGSGRLRLVVAQLVVMTALEGTSMRSRRLLVTTGLPSTLCSSERLLVWQGRHG